MGTRRRGFGGEGGDAVVSVNVIDLMLSMRLHVRTCRRDELEVMRHRGVVDEGVCDHLVCCDMSNKDTEYNLWATPD